MTDVGDETLSVRLGIALLAAIAVLLVVDLLADSREGIGFLHLASELGAATLAAGGLVWLSLRLRELVRQRRELGRQLAATRDEAHRWRQEAGDLLVGLRRAIDRQFDRWELTPAEREVSMYLLRGLSHKEIAARREASERTVRQQAHTVYRKAGISGRADLSAFFLEDLLPPTREPSEGSSSAG